MSLWLVAPDHAVGRPGRLRVLARDVSLALDEPERISIRNHLPVTIERIDGDTGAYCTLACRLSDDQLLLAQITRWSVSELGLEPGMRVYALIKSVSLLE
jgi:molybdate transport system ATP-binding protein